jgi:hypothetical protein
VRSRGSPTTSAGTQASDAKIGITQGLTADFTYNTDFAQVEADEQQINLTRFSLFFPEKREFFLENLGLFGFGGVGATGGGDIPILFHSRRIGFDSGARGADRGRRQGHGTGGPVQPGPSGTSSRTRSRRSARRAPTSACCG